MIMHLPPFITLVSWFLEVCYKVPSQWSCLGLSKKKSTTFWLMSTKGRYNTLLECDLSTKRKYACGRLKSPHDIHSMFCFLLFWMQRCTVCFYFRLLFFLNKEFSCHITLFMTGECIHTFNTIVNFWIQGKQTAPFVQHRRHSSN